MVNSGELVYRCGRQEKFFPKGTKFWMAFQKIFEQRLNKFTAVRKFFLGKTRNFE